MSPDDENTLEKAVRTSIGTKILSMFFRETLISFWKKSRVCPRMRKYILRKHAKKLIIFLATLVRTSESQSTNQIPVATHLPPPPLSARGCRTALAPIINSLFSIADPKPQHFSGSKFVRMEWFCTFKDFRNWAYCCRSDRYFKSSLPNLYFFKICKYLHFTSKINRQKEILEFSFV